MGVVDSPGGLPYQISIPINIKSKPDKILSRANAPILLILHNASGGIPGVNGAEINGTFEPAGY